MSDDGIIFSPAWAQALGRELNQSGAYRTAASRWEGSLVLALDGAGPPTGVFLDLHRGSCRAAREVEREDLQRAEFVIRAGTEVWRRVLAGELEPLWAVLSGQLRLARGNPARLAPFPGAARELVAAAARVGGRFPDGS